MPKLYNVTATIEYVIVVEDDDAAELDKWAIAEDVFRDVMYDTDVTMVDIFVNNKPVETPADLARTWDDECIPYGGDGNTRISEYLK